MEDSEDASGIRYEIHAGTLISSSMTNKGFKDRSCASIPSKSISTTWTSTTNYMLQAQRGEQ